ncbi:hypothetical protein Q8F55_001599 [Vanrija albida]|uniref:Transmembrane protein n=1 Tax=Vanrija albida TaxID=181172 RepID=A0ABR3QGG2_9TREE
MRAGSLPVVAGAVCLVLAAGISAAPAQGLVRAADGASLEFELRQIKQHSDPAESTVPTATTATDAPASSSATATDSAAPHTSHYSPPAAKKKKPETAHNRSVSIGMAVLALGAVVLFYSAIWLTAWRAKVVRARRRGHKPERLRDWIRREMCIGGEGCIIGPRREEQAVENDYELVGREQLARGRAPKDLGL